MLDIDHLEFNSLCLFVIVFVIRVLILRAGATGAFTKFFAIFLFSGDLSRRRLSRRGFSRLSRRLLYRRLILWLIIGNRILDRCLLT